MARAKPNHAETLAIMRHLADVIALRSDPPAQRKHLIDGLNDLLNTDCGFFYVADNWRLDRPAYFTHQTFTTRVDTAAFGYISHFGITYALDDDPFCHHSRRSDAPIAGWTLHGILRDKAAYRQFSNISDLINTTHLRDSMVTYFRGGNDGGMPDRLVGFSLHRLGKAKTLNEKEQALAQFAIEEVQRMVRLGYVSLPDDLPYPLAPRLRQVLDRLLAGQAPKRIARELRLSLWTVREHVKRLYQHFGVSGRDELMSRFIGKTLTTFFSFLPLFA